MPTIHLLITGDVQGVFFRATSGKVAEKLGIKGWVKNTRKGEVEMEINGDQDKLEEFTRWCKKGPPKAMVEEVVITPLPEKIYNEFAVIR